MTVSRGRPPRRPPAAALATRKPKDPDTAAAITDLDDAVREIQRDGRLPRTGDPGDIFYRGGDGRVVRLVAGSPSMVLVVGPDGLPRWAAPAGVVSSGTGVGASGAHGPPGLDGYDGEDGRPGRDGRDGRDGIAGPPGPPGIDGEDGADGPRGVDGLPGASGPPGAPGPPGADGEDGADGPPGPQGPKGDAGPAGGGGASATIVEVNLGTVPISSGKFTITDAAIAATSKVLAWQAPGPYTGKGSRADEAELQPVRVIAVNPSAGSAVCMWETPPITTVAPVVPNGRLTTTTVAQNQVPQRAETRRLNRVRGNVKFAYVVFS